MNFVFDNHEVKVTDESGKILVRATFPVIKEGVVNINHTYVDPSLRGQGIASILMTKVCDFLVEKNIKWVATCPYAVVWLKKHPEYNSMIDIETQTTLAPECQI
mgnify:CR=1 FL=1